MKRRLLRSQPSISFFAFQDIITAVTGVILLVTLLMALEITKPLTTSAVAEPSRIALRDSLRDELAQLNLQATTANADKKATMADEAAAQAEAANLNDLAEVLEAETEKIARNAASLESLGQSDVDVDAVRAANEQAAAEIRVLREKSQEITSRIEQARVKVETAEQAVLSELKNTQDLWLIPERSRSSKEPVIISILEDRFAVQPVDSREMRDVKRQGNLDADLGAALDGLDPSKQYIVFYFRPATLGDFNVINQKAKGRRFEIGYDLVEDGAQVRFAVAPEIVPHVGGPTSSPEQETPPSEDASPPQTVQIEKESEERGKPQTTGSGFFISEDGYIATNEHVVAGGGTVFVGSPSIGWLRAQKVAADSDLDLALLKVEGERFSPLPVARSETVRLGQTVATIGFPNTVLQGISPKCTKGEVASLAGMRDDPSMFQISVAVQPGNSGGPLFDMRGNVVGVVTGKINQDLVFEMTGTIAENVNFAVKSTKLLDWVAEQKPPNLRLAPVNSDEAAQFEDAVSDAEKASVMIVVYP